MARKKHFVFHFISGANMQAQYSIYLLSILSLLTIFFTR